VTRLFWFNVAAVVLFGGLAAYQFLGERFRPLIAEAQLLAPIENAQGEAEVRARAEALVRTAHAANQSARSSNRMMGGLALIASFLCLWNAITMSELREAADAAAALDLDDDDDEEDL